MPHKFVSFIHFTTHFSQLLFLGGAHFFFYLYKKHLRGDKTAGIFTYYFTELSVLIKNTNIHIKLFTNENTNLQSFFFGFLLSGFTPFNKRVAAVLCLFCGKCCAAAAYGRKKKRRKKNALTATARARRK